MGRKQLLLAASALLAGAAVLFAVASWRSSKRHGRTGFVQTNGARFEIDGKPFRFVGANVDLLFRQDTRDHFEDIMHVAANNGISVVRVWVSGEGGPEDVQPFKGKRDRWLRRTPEQWNEQELLALDHVLDQAARKGIRVQLCLANWWREG